ncbi:MAG: arginase family protein [Desulfobacterales bacterium]|nr:MAG: arginase family protein [Desulfobacterales bacterium]
MGKNSADNYLLKPRKKARHRFAYIGVPHNPATSLGNPGSRSGPQALREALLGIFEWRMQDHRLADIDRGPLDLSAVEITDLGNIALSYHDTERTVQQTHQAVLNALKAGYFPLIVGGDHGVTYPSVKALHDICDGPLGLIQLDAHCDMLDFSDQQGRFSGSSGMRRSLDLDRLAGPNLVQVGLRGYTTIQQYEAGQNFGVRQISATRLNEIGVRAAAEQALEWSGTGTQAIYLTVDLDVVNPGEAPGTGWPEPGGLTGQQLIDFVRVVAPCLAAIDIAELNPIYDSRAHATAILAARVLFDCICARIKRSD